MTCSRNPCWQPTIESGDLVLVSRAHQRSIVLRLSFDPTRVAEYVKLRATRDPERAAIEAGLTADESRAVENALAEAGIFVSSPPVRRGGRYDRQLLFLDQYATDSCNGGDFHERLAAAQVLIVGVGSFGSTVATRLARSGVGAITLVDFDTVEETNLERQLLFSVEDLGEPKVHAAARRLRWHSPDCEITSVERRVTCRADLDYLLVDKTLVLNSFGMPDAGSERGRTGDLISMSTWEADLPCMTFGPYLGPLTVPGATLSPRAMAAAFGGSPLDRGYMRTDNASPALGVRQAILCELVAWEALCWLTRITTPASLGAVISLDVSAYERHSVWRPRSSLMGKAPESNWATTAAKPIT